MEKASAIIQEIEGEVPEDRKQILDGLIHYLGQAINDRGRAQVVFICTHNSRRSQLAQAWSIFLAEHYQVPVNALSGGTEVTVLHKHVVDTLRRSGCTLEIIENNDSNPKYALRWDDFSAPVTLYSKLYNDEVNPESHFAAVMTCSSADKDCPFVSGAEARFSLTYEDPKKADGSPEAAKTYNACSMRIANELNYVFKSLKKYE